MPKTKSGKPIPYQTGGGATRTNTEGVTYTKKADADKYAASINGTVVEVDKDGDGATDGYNVIVPQTPSDEGVTRGPNPSGLIPEENATLKDFKTALDQAKYLKKVEEGGKPRNMGGAVVDELGYTQGDMGFTKRGPVKYSKGGAVKGKTFSGIY